MKSRDPIRQAVGLYERYHRNGDLEQLNTAIELLSRALDSTPARHRDYAEYLFTLGALLQARFRETGELADLDRAITACQKAVNASGASHPARVGALANLAGALSARFERTGAAEDIDAAIVAVKQALRAASTREPNRAGMLTNLGTMLRMRFDQTGELADLDGAITACQKAVRASGAANPDRAEMLANLASALTTRFERTGKSADIDAAIVAGKQALVVTPADGPDRAGMLSNLGLALRTRFERTGQAADLDAAIQACQKAVNAAPEGHPARARYLSGYAAALSVRFEQTGQSADIDAAVAALRQAVDATPADHMHRALILANLGCALQSAYLRTWRSSDLDAAITICQQAVDAAPADHPHRARYLSNLALALGARSDWPSRTEDVDAAIAVGQQAVDITPADHPSLPTYLSNLGLTYQYRFELSGNLQDLEAAITATQRAVDACPPDHPFRAGMLSNLGAMLRLRFERLGHIGDLDAAVTVGQQAADATPFDHPRRAQAMSQLADALQQRAGRTGQPADLDDAIRCWRDAAGVATASPLLRVEAARIWGRLAFDAHDMVSALDGYAVAVSLLPEAVWHGLDRSTREEHLVRWAGLASDAAACALAAGQSRKAVELLEQGRSVLWTQALHLRSDLARLREHAPRLASRMDEIRRILDEPLPGKIPSAPDILTDEDAAAASSATEERMVRERRQLAREWDELLGQVRQLDGFAHFLAPIPFADLRAAAAEGSVVIVNVSSLGCHALIITAGGNDGVRAIPLPSLTHEDAIGQAGKLLAALNRIYDAQSSFAARSADRKAIFDVLQWLWQLIAAPVLRDLGHTRRPDGEPLPRVWWCPTGPLTLLPLHAAGDYSRTASPPARPAETVLVRVVSSYTPTLTALKRARDAPAAAHRDVQQLAVGMPVTPGHQPLPGVPEELGILAEYFPPPLKGRHLIADDATGTAVLEALPGCSWVHLACHAMQDPDDPSASSFALHDGPLPLTHLTALRMDNAELAFLSACQTAAGNNRLPDEAIHLAAAMQLLGYRHVIATLWTIADTPAPELVRIVYGTLTGSGQPDPSRAAYALHDAVEHLRQAHPATPHLWAAYIHIGP